MKPIRKAIKTKYYFQFKYFEQFVAANNVTVTPIRKNNISSVYQFVSIKTFGKVLDNIAVFD